MTLPMRMIRYLGRGTSGRPCLRKVGMRIPNTRRQIQLATRAVPTATRPATPPQTPPVLRGSQGRRAERQAGTGTCAHTTRSDPCGRVAATGLGNLRGSTESSRSTDKADAAVRLLLHPRGTRDRKCLPHQEYPLTNQSRCPCPRHGGTHRPRFGWHRLAAHQRHPPPLHGARPPGCRVRGRQQAKHRHRARTPMRQPLTRRQDTCSLPVSPWLQTVLGLSQNRLGVVAPLVSPR